MKLWALALLALPAAAQAQIYTPPAGGYATPVAIVTCSAGTCVPGGGTGGGGGGGGGPITVADGADTAEGLTTATAYTDTTGAASGTITGINKGQFVKLSSILSALGSPLQQGGSVSITNLPATQPVSGTISVSNFPSTQPVSGSVSVSNLPATQPVSGTVSVGNFPATQPVSGTVSVNTNAIAQGSTTSSQTGPLIQGSVTTAAPTYTTATTAPLSLDTAGNLRSTVAGLTAQGATYAANPVGTGCYASATTQTAVTAGQLARTWCNLNGSTVVSLAPGSVQAIADGSSNNFNYWTDPNGATPGLSAITYGKIFNGTGWDRSAGLNATTIGAGVGVQAVGNAPTSAAPQGIVPTGPAYNTASVVAKATAGNLFNVNEENSTQAHWLIVYDATAIPAAGAALTASLELFSTWCPAAASSTVGQSCGKEFQWPIRSTNGLVILTSTTLPIYTATTTPPLRLTYEVK